MRGIGQLGAQQKCSNDLTQIAFGFEVALRDPVHERRRRRVGDEARRKLACQVARSGGVARQATNQVLPLLDLSLISF